MGKPSQFELNTREKLRKLRTYLEDLESKRDALGVLIQAAYDKKSILDDLFDEANGQGGDDAGSAD